MAPFLTPQKNSRFERASSDDDYKRGVWVERCNIAIQWGFGALAVLFGVLFIVYAIQNSDANAALAEERACHDYHASVIHLEPHPLIQTPIVHSNGEYHVRTDVSVDPSSCEGKWAAALRRQGNTIDAPSNATGRRLQTDGANTSCPSHHHVMNGHLIRGPVPSDKKCKCKEFYASGNVSAQTEDNGISFLVEDISGTQITILCTGSDMKTGTTASSFSCNTGSSPVVIFCKVNGVTGTISGSVCVVQLQTQ